VVVVTVPPVVPLVDPEVVVDVVVVPFAPQPLKVSTAVLTIRPKIKAQKFCLIERIIEFFPFTRSAQYS
jgi:hypothetical protein